MVKDGTLSSSLKNLFDQSREIQLSKDDIPEAADV